MQAHHPSKPISKEQTKMSIEHLKHRAEVHELALKYDKAHKKDHEKSAKKEAKDLEKN